MTDERLERLSDLIRQGVPVDASEALEVIEYQERKNSKRERHMKLFRMISNFFEERKMRKSIVLLTKIFEKDSFNFEVAPKEDKESLKKLYRLLDSSERFYNTEISDQFARSVLIKELGEECFEKFLKLDETTFGSLVRLRLQSREPSEVETESVTPISLVSDK